VPRLAVPRVPTAVALTLVGGGGTFVNQDNARTEAALTAAQAQFLIAPGEALR
jgi:hypothetical protein